MSVRQMKALIMKIETVTLFGKGKIECDMLYILSV